MKKLHIPEYGAPIEHAIVRALVAYLGSHGWRPKCATYGEGNQRVRTEREVLDYIFAVDRCAVAFKKRRDSYDVIFVCGNGDALISDWKYSDGDAGTAFNALMDTFAKAIDGAPVAFILPGKQS